MRRLGALALLALVACGGGEPGLGLSIDATSRGLFPNMTTARISLYPGDTSCLGIELSSAATLGLHNQTMSVNAADDAATGVLFDLRAGTYALAVWGFDAGGVPIAFGCLEGVEIVNGEQTEETIVLGSHTP
ncbi:MAG: hypothetical protein RL846_13870 [Deltaproteobacteria bacterium]